MNKIKDTANKIRLLHLVHGLGMGGAEIALFHYIKSFGMEEYDHFVYCFGTDGPVRKKIEALGVPVRMVKDRDTIKRPIKFGISLLALIRDLLHYIRKQRIQIIQSHTGHSNELAMFTGKLCRVPTFPTIHSTMASVDNRSFWDPRKHLIKAVDGGLFRIADRIIAVSQEIKEIMQNKYGLDESKILVLKNGIYIDEDLTEPLDILKEIPTLSNKLKLIAVGRLVPLKAFDILVRAVADLVNQGLNNFLVLIVGEGNERVRLEILIKSLSVENYVKLLGLRHDVMAIMRACDLFVIPSHYEGLSIAMIEAMACALPIIASDAPGLRDHIAHEKNGMLFPVNNHKALAENIIRLANDGTLRTRLSHRARKCFEREYNMRKNIKSLDTLFRKYCTRN